MPVLDDYDLRVEFGSSVAYTGSDVALARVLIRSYTRGVGCPTTDAGDWPTDLLAVTHLVSTRLHSGDFTRATESFGVDEDIRQSYFAPFRGFSLVERQMLDRHRRRII